MPDDRKPLATPEELAEWLQCKTSKLAKMRMLGTGPRFIKNGREIRYAWLDVHKWADQLRQDSTKGTDG